MHPLDGSFLKLRRAKYHLEIVDELIKGLHKNNPYRLIGEFIGNRYTREHIIRFEQTKEIPTDVSLLIGDICNNLRSALDYLLWQLWLLKDPSFSKNVKFPIWDSESLFKSKAPKDIGRDSITGLSDIQRTTIESLQPYKTGQPALSLLRDVNDSDKHRLIQVVALVGNVEKIRITRDQTKSALRLPNPPQIKLRIANGSEIKDGTILTRIPLPPTSRGAQVRVQSNITIDYAFKGSKTANRQSINPSLNAMISEVALAINVFEPEFTQFGVSQFK